MNDRRATKLDPEVLSEPVRTRLLERASELDAAYRAGGTLAELRAAAVEAGISTRAFDAALAELRPAEDTPLAEVSAQPPRRSRLWPITAGALALIAVGAIGVARSPTPVGPAPSMVEQAFLLRCLSPGQAAELVRPLLDLPTNTVVYSPERAARMLTIRATREQIESVRSVLNKLDARSPTCAR